MPVFLLKEYGQTPRNRPLNFRSGTPVPRQDYMIKADVIPITELESRDVVKDNLNVIRLFSQ